MPTRGPWNALTAKKKSNPSELHNNLYLFPPPKLFRNSWKWKIWKMLFFVIDEHRTNSPPPPPDLDSKLSFGVRVSCAFTWNFHFTLDDEWRIASCKCTIWYAPEKLKVFTLAYDWWMDGICFLGIRFCCIWFFWYDFCELIVINKGWNSFTFNAITFNFRLLQEEFFFSLVLGLTTRFDWKLSSVFLLLCKKWIKIKLSSPQIVFHSLHLRTGKKMRKTVSVFALRMSYF